jgi:Fe-S-cluster containining protein
MTGDLAAGNFSSWVAGMQAALRGDADSDVPCGGCSACCTSSQFVHIGPDEIDALAHIPADLLFPAPQRPAGHVVLGYDERGHCPMLVDDRCSIYAHRPQTCRMYDCRVFTASGVELDDESKAEIAARTRRWRFDFPTPADGARFDACRAAATFVHAHRDGLPDDFVPRNATEAAVLAVDLHDVFLERDAVTGEPAVVVPSLDAVRVAIGRSTA